MNDHTAADQRADASQAAQSEPADHQPTHKRFSWTDGAAHVIADAAFVEQTLDLAAGINTCLEIVYASNLERLANTDADAGQTRPPAVGIVEADQLMRMAMASAATLRDSARDRVECAKEVARMTAS